MVSYKKSHSHDEDQGGVHIAIDVSQGGAFTWAVAELAAALQDIGVPVSLPRASPSPTLAEGLQLKLSKFMSRDPYKSHHIRLNHYWPQHFMQELSGEINVEFFVTNYRFRGENQPLDMWSRNLVTNGIRKVAMSSFCRDSLQDIGVSGTQCAVVPLGYSPEIETLFPAGRPPVDSAVRKILVVTNSHDLRRYGTDILIPAIAAAFAPQDPVEVHIKDYGASSGSSELRDLIASQDTFPKVFWHENFLSKEDLIRLYAEMHLMVSPFRGEGYAMKIIDAMAIGLPVMMPTFGGPMEYAHPNGFLPLLFDEVPVGECYDTAHYLVGPGAYWCQVRQDSLVHSLRSYLADPAAAESAAAVARTHVVGRYTWKNAALSLMEALRRWRTEVNTKTLSRRRPSTLPLSVIMPTKDRPAELAKTLAGYAAQHDQSFELVIVNDYGDGTVVREIVSSFGKSLRARVIDNRGASGPGAARNLGLEEAEGKLFLITGDDIIPAPDLIIRHRAAHGLHPETEAAFVGKVEWHPDMPNDWFLEHIVGEGAQQFNYRALSDQQEVPFDRFYTSNISWKRALTADLEQIFSPAFRYAAYEDIELGYRLSLRGLKLRFLSGALGYHLHPMTVQSFLERMLRVGSMHVVLSGMHPQLVGREGLRFYEYLETERRRRASLVATPSAPSWESLIAPSVQAFQALDMWLTAKTLITGAAQRNISEMMEEVQSMRRVLFDELCASYQKIGQAQEWSREVQGEDWAAAWTAMLAVAQRQVVTASPTSPLSLPKRVKAPKLNLHAKNLLKNPSLGKALRRWILGAKPQAER
jgi:glycosyltransferase involved in cell wall biosynthesis/GT2 family glycosyltransferase